MRDLSAKLKRVLPYAADVGSVAYGALCTVIVACAVAEFLAPGFVADFVAPQGLAAAAFLAGALSLVDLPKGRPSLVRRAFYGAAGAAATAFAFSAAWYYFVPVPEAQLPLAWASGTVVALLFLAYAGRPATPDGNA